LPPWPPSAMACTAWSSRDDGRAPEFTGPEHQRSIEGHRIRLTKVSDGTANPEE